MKKREKGGEKRRKEKENYCGGGWKEWKVGGERKKEWKGGKGEKGMEK